MTERQHQFQVPDISCEHCVRAITEALAPLEGVDTVEIDLDTKTVSVAGGAVEAIVAAIDEAGYDVT